MEEMQAHKAKYGRWSREALAASSDVLLWVLMMMSRLARAPLQHLLAFMQARVSSDTMSLCGNQLCQLATGKAESILLEFMAVADNPAFLDCADIGIQDRAAGAVQSFGMALLLHYTGGFYRRIALPLSRSDMLMVMAMLTIMLSRLVAVMCH